MGEENPDSAKDAAETMSIGSGVASEATLPGEGDVVRYFGDYRLNQEVARGGMGVVFKAHQMSLNRTVALKMILSGRFAGAAELQRFRNEAEAAARLDHPNIVPIYEVGEFKGLSYYTMKFIEGGSLASRMKEFALPTACGQDPSIAVGRKQLRQCHARIATLMATVARAVHYAHLRGILHRDLKPANILVDNNGVPHVTDLGIAKRLEDERGMTQAGAVLGTPAYMSPEQAGGAGGLTTAADVYSLGAILYELLCGQSPFVGSDVLSMLRRIAEEEAKEPRLLCSLVDRDLSTICMKCLQKDPAGRYGSAMNLAEDLERWSRGEPILARPSRRHERAIKWVRRHPATTAFVAAIVMITLTGFSAVTWQWLRAEKALQGYENNYYGVRIALAQQEWVAGNLTRGDEHLAECKPALRGWEWHYLKRLCHPNWLRLSGHGDKATALAFSPDGENVASASLDRTIIIWDVHSGAEIRRLEHDLPVFGVAYSPDGSKLAAFIGSGNGNYGMNGVVAPVANQNLVVWDLYLVKQLARRSAFTAPQERHEKRIPGGLKFSPDGRRLLYWRSEKEYVLWDILTGEDLLTLRASAGVVFSRDGKYLKTTQGIYSLDNPDAVARQTPAAEVQGFVAAANFEHSHELPSLQKNGLFYNRYRDAVRTWDGQWIAATDGFQLAIENAMNFGKPVAAARLEGSEASVAYSSDEIRLATLSDNDSRFSGLPGTMTLNIWDGRMGRDSQEFQGNELPGSNVSFSGSGRYVSAVTDVERYNSYDARLPIGPGRMRVWDLASGQQVLSLGADYDRPGSVAISENGAVVAVAGFHGAAVVWNGTTGKKQLVLRGHDGPVRSIAITPDGTRIATSGKDGVRVWGAQAGNLQYLIEAENKKGTGLTTVLQFSPDGALLAVADAGRLLRGQFTADDGSVVYRKRGPGNYSSGEGADTRLYDADTGNPVRVVQGGFDKAFARPSAIWQSETRLSQGLPSPNGKRVARITGAQPNYKLSISSDGNPAIVFKGHRNEVLSMAWSSNSDRLVTASDDGTVKIWDAQTGSNVLTVYDDERAAHLARWSPGEDRLAAACWDNAIRVWKAGEWSTERILRGHTDTISDLAWSSDGKRIATASEDGTVRIWDIEPAREAMSLSGHQGAVYAVSWSPDDRQLATSGADGGIRLWDVVSGRELHWSHPEPKDPISLKYLQFRRLAWSPAGRFIAADASDDYSVRSILVWDAASGRRQDAKTLSGYNSSSWTPDGRYLCFQDKGDLAFWDVQTKQAIPKLRGVSWWTGPVAFTPDGTRGAISGGDGSVVLWNVQTSQQLLSLRRLKKPVAHLGFSRDGHQLAAVDQDGAVKVWDATPVDQLRGQRSPSSTIDPGPAIARARVAESKMGPIVRAMLASGETADAVSAKLAANATLTSEERAAAQAEIHTSRERVRRPIEDRQRQGE